MIRVKFTCQTESEMKQLQSPSDFARHLIFTYKNPLEIVDGIKHFNEFIFPYRNVIFKESEMYKYLTNVELCIKQVI